MQRLLFLWLGVVGACVPALRVYDAGKLTSTKRTFSNVQGQQLKYKGVENVFLLVKPSGLLQKPAQPGVAPKDRAPIALTLFCPSGSGIVRTIAVVPHLLLPPFLWPAIWYPSYTKVYCADAPSSQASSTPSSDSTLPEQPAAPTREEEAARFFEQAEIDYKLLKYSSALENYQRAYEKVQSPELLFNIAQCYRLLERHQEAITTYETFLREDPNTPVKAEVERLVAESKKKLKQQKKSK